MAGDRHDLEHGNVGHGVEEVLIVRGVHPVAVAGVVELRERCGHDHDVYPALGAVHEVASDDPYRPVVLRDLGGYAAEEHGDDLHPSGLQTADEPVNVLQIAVDPAVGCEQESGDGLRRIETAQIVFEGHVPGAVGVVYAVRRVLLGCGDIAFAGQLPVEPSGYALVVLSSSGADVPAQVHVLLVGALEEVAVHQGDVEIP